MSKGVPLLPLNTRGARLHDGVLVGLQGRSPSWLQLYLLYLRKARFYPNSARSFLKPCAVVHVYPIWSSRSGLPSVQVAVLGRRVDTRGDVLHRCRYHSETSYPHIWYAP